MATGDRNDPFRSYNFSLEIDGIDQARFSECSGFSSEVEAIEYREGGEPLTVRKLPGKVTYSDISLKWGKTDSYELYQWHRKAVLGQIERKNGSIILLDDAGDKEIGRWNFYEAWPKKWEGPSLNATGSEVAIETLTLVCERLEAVA